MESLCKCGCKRLTTPGKTWVKGHHRRGQTSRGPLRSPQPCKCGCGGLAKPGNTFILGHNVLKPKPAPVLCLCGCGKFAMPGKRYLVGHNGRGQPAPNRVTPPEPRTGICLCGCGRKTSVTKTTCRAANRFKGFPALYFSGHTPRSKNGRSSGYVRVLAKDHPHADKHGYMAQHRLVMEKKLGRFLEPHERIHHKNGIKDDNRPRNLELWKITKKDPAGVRATDYHCPGCRCFE